MNRKLNAQQNCKRLFEEIKQIKHRQLYWVNIPERKTYACTPDTEARNIKNSILISAMDSREALDIAMCTYAALDIQNIHLIGG